MLVGGEQNGFVAQSAAEKSCWDREKMSKVQLVKQRLTAAAEEILGLFERTVEEYEEKVCRLEERNKRQRRLLDAVFTPQLLIHRADAQLLIANGGIPSEQQERSSSLDQEPPHIKVEELQLEEADVTTNFSHPLSVKREDDKIQFSQLHQTHTDPPSSTVCVKSEELQPESFSCSLDGLMEAGANGEEPQKNPDQHLGGALDCSKVPANNKRLNNKKKLSCSECGETFGYRTSLKRHIATHTGEKPFSCSVCNERFTQKAHQVKHMAKHNGEKRFGCSLCDRRFIWYFQLNRHRCSGKQKQTARAEEKVKKSEDQNQIKPVEAARVETMSDVETQKSSEAETDDSNSWKESGVTVNTGQQSEKQLCGFNSDSAPKMAVSNQNACSKSLSHYKTERPLSCQLCKRRFKLLENLKLHRKTHVKKQHQCSLCEKAFWTRTKLVCHMRWHTAEKPYSCSVCQKSFSVKESLEMHIKKHEGKKPFPCSVCQLSFSSKHAVANHQRTHSGENPFSCSLCGQRFSCNGSVTRHMRMHTGEKPFSCSVCKMSFRWKHVFVEHMRDHSGEKPFSCKHCDRRFARLSAVKVHQQRCRRDGCGGSSSQGKSLN